MGFPIRVAKDYPRAAMLADGTIDPVNLLQGRVRCRPQARLPGLTPPRRLIAKAELSRRMSRSRVEAIPEDPDAANCGECAPRHRQNDPSCIDLFPVREFELETVALTTNDGQPAAEGHSSTAGCEPRSEFARES